MRIRLCTLLGFLERRQELVTRHVIVEQELWCGRSMAGLIRSRAKGSSRPHLRRRRVTKQAARPGGLPCEHVLPLARRVGWPLYPIEPRCDVDGRRGSHGEGLGASQAVEDWQLPWPWPWLAPPAPPSHISLHFRCTRSATLPNAMLSRRHRSCIMLFRTDPSRYSYSFVSRSAASAAATIRRRIGEFSVTPSPKFLSLPIRAAVPARCLGDQPSDHPTSSLSRYEATGVELLTHGDTGIKTGWTDALPDIDAPTSYRSFCFHSEDDPIPSPTQLCPSDVMCYRRIRVCARDKKESNLLEERKVTRLQPQTA